MHIRRTPYWLIALLALAGCGVGLDRAQPAARGGPSAALAPVRISAQPLRQPQACTAAFVAHALDFTTEVRGDTIHLFDSNGAGVAVGDLDGDGRQDLVFANLDGPDAIFWNQGNFVFRK